jgi:hypothetical protein
MVATSRGAPFSSPSELESASTSTGRLDGTGVETAFAASMTAAVGFAGREARPEGPCAGASRVMAAPRPRPAGCPLARPRPRPRPRVPSAPSSSSMRLLLRTGSERSSCPRAIASSRFCCLSSARSFVGHRFLRSAIQSSIFSGVSKTTPVPCTGTGFLNKDELHFRS